MAIKWVVEIYGIGELQFFVENHVQSTIYFKVFVEAFRFHKCEDSK